MSINVREKVKLAPYTTFKIGGPASFFAEVKNEIEIKAAIKFANDKKLPIFFLGGGSNILVSDKGFDGLVIKIQNSALKIEDDLIFCGAGCLLSEAVSKSAKAGLSGLEWAVGIPGTIGGAIRGNAGAFGGDMTQIVDAVEVFNIKKQKAEFYSGKKCKFGYRDSVFKSDPNLIILSVKLQLAQGDPKKSQETMKEIIAKRTQKQPVGSPSAGSFFKNPKIDNPRLKKFFQIDTGSKLKDEKIPAGYLIDSIGFRGKKIGGAMVSNENSNFIINTGKAKSEDVIILAAIIKTKIRNKYNILLEEEVQMVGF